MMFDMYDGPEFYERGDGSMFFICDICSRKVDGKAYQAHIDNSCPIGNWRLLVHDYENH